MSPEPLSTRLSVIVAHSPGRGDALRYCLQHLLQQSHLPAEIWICDDGSDDAELIADCVSQGAHSHPQIAVQHLWRANDRNLSRSRNQGAQAATGDVLLFLNSDVLLNREALKAYATVLQQQPELTLWGYIGCRKAVSAPSQWHQNLRVNWLDFRFFPVSTGQVWVHPDFQQRPHHYAGGHHFALRATSYCQIGPLNENFVDWGDEDVEYALRGMLRGHPMCLLGDAWAEHVAHAYAERFHLEARQQAKYKAQQIQVLEQGLNPELKRAGVLFGPQLPVLFEAIQAHYLPHQPDALQSEMQRLKF